VEPEQKRLKSLNCILRNSKTWPLFPSVKFMGKTRRPSVLRLAWHRSASGCISNIIFTVAVTSSLSEAEVAVESPCCKVEREVIVIG